MSVVPLSQLPVGESALVRELRSSGLTRRRMQDLGFLEGASVKSLQRAPGGDPTAYQVGGAVIALRAEDSSSILVQPQGRGKKPLLF